MAFEELLEAIGSYLGTTAEVAGFIAGTAVILVLLIVVMLVLSGEKSNVIMPVSSVGIMLVVLIGWWPLWTIIFMLAMVAFMVINPFKETSGA